MKNFLISSFFLLSSVTGHRLFAQGIEFIHDKPFSQILEQAKKEGKLVFMDCYTSWCGPCKRLAAVVFPDSAVGEFYNRTFVNTKFDMEKGEGTDIANRYSIRAYPTLLWLDGDGNVKHKIVGGLDATGLIANGKKAVDPTPGILTGMRQKYKDGNREPDFLREFVNTLYNSGEKYEDYFKEYLEKLSDKNFTDPAHTKTIFNLTNDLKSPGLAYIMKNHDYYVTLMGGDGVNKKINQIAEKAVKEAPKADDRALFDGAIELVRNNKAPDAQEKILKLSMDYFQHMGNWVDYDKNASQYIKKFASKKANEINDIAWNYYLNIHNTDQLVKAAKWALNAINTDNKYTYNLTYAYLLYKLEDFKEAEKACDYALIVAEKEGANTSSATFLKDAIKKTVERKN